MLTKLRRRVLATFMKKKNEKKREENRFFKIYQIISNLNPRKICGVNGSANQ